MDFHRGCSELKLDWNTTAIDVAGRGGDRGLRGIAFHGERILVAANAELLVLNRSFEVMGSYKNPYLRHCHEVCVDQDLLYLTSTGFDSLLAFDLQAMCFRDAWHLATRQGALALSRFDPQGAGPAESHVFHLNAVTAARGRIWFSGLYTPGLLRLDRNGLGLEAPLPSGTHNAQLWDGGLLFNDTAANCVRFRRGDIDVAIQVPDFDLRHIINLERFASEVARPRFARGLCPVSAGCVVGGSSPSTISLHDLSNAVTIKRVNLSMDVRNAVHGLAVWPYG